MKYLIFILIISFISSCNRCRVTITTEYLKSPCENIFGFSISKIDVSKVDSIGKPVDYSIKEKLSFGINASNSSIGLKKVNFHSKNIGGDWMYETRGDNFQNSVDILPFKFENGSWYLFKRVPVTGCLYCEETTTYFVKAGKGKKFDTVFRHFDYCNCYKKIK